MVTKQSRYLVDTRFIVKRTHDSFVGAPLLTVDGEDHTFTFGFVRDVLRLRQLLGIEVLLLVLGEDARSITIDQNIYDLITFLDEIRFPYIYVPANTTLDIVSHLSGQYSHIITADKRFLQLSRDDLVIVLCDESSGSPKHFSFASIKAQFGVNPSSIPTYLALTAGSKNNALTHRQAIRLIEIYGDFEAIYQNLNQLSSAAVRKRLLGNEHEVRQYYSESVIHEHPEPMAYRIKKIALNLDRDKNRQVFNNYGFYSLLTLLSTPPKVDLALPRSSRQSESYIAVVNRKTIEELEAHIKPGAVCSIDTESDDKNPKTATLLGISFCFSEGHAYFIPLIEHYLEDLDRDHVLRFLNRVLNSNVNIIGHNVKYDYILVRKSGIKMRFPYFDTMLAAYDCYGDWEYFNLKHLAHKLLGRQIKGYRDLVDRDSSLLDVPFSEMVQHGCQDADIAFRLHTVLMKQLKQRKLEKHYITDTMAHLRRVCDLEFNGLSVDERKLDKIRGLLLKDAVCLRDEIFEKIGGTYDLDSQKDLSSILTEILDLRRFAWVKRISLRFLEQAAITEPTVRLIVRYKRIRKKIKAVEAISTSVLQGKIYPTFHFGRSPCKLVATSKPNVFDIEGLDELRSCFDQSLQVYFRDTQKALDILAAVTKDSVLKRVRGSESKVDSVIKKYPTISSCDHDELLLSLVIGSTDSYISRRFLADRITVGAIRHDVEKRYATLFKWIQRFRMNSIRSGYAAANGRRKYIDGLRSSNIAKKRRAQEHVVRWLIGL